MSGPTDAAALPTGSVATPINGKPAVEVPAAPAFDAAATPTAAAEISGQEQGAQGAGSAEGGDALAPEPADYARFEKIKGATRTTELSAQFNIDPSL